MFRSVHAVLHGASPCKDGIVLARMGAPAIKHFEIASTETETRHNCVSVDELNQNIIAELNLTSAQRHTWVVFIGL